LNDLSGEETRQQWRRQQQQQRRRRWRHQWFASSTCTTATNRALQPELKESKIIQIFSAKWASVTGLGWGGSHRASIRSSSTGDGCDSVTLCDQVVLILRLLWNCKSVIGMLTSGLPNFTRGQSSHVCFQPFHRCVYSPPPRINLFLHAAEAAAESIISFICQMHGGWCVWMYGGWKIQFSLPSPSSLLVVFNTSTCANLRPCVAPLRCIGRCDGSCRQTLPCKLLSPSLVCVALGGEAAAAGHSHPTFVVVWNFLLMIVHRPGGPAAKMELITAFE
jgi:hypothetical protein